MRARTFTVQLGEVITYFHVGFHGGLLNLNDDRTHRIIYRSNICVVARTLTNTHVIENLRNPLTFRFFALVHAAKMRFPLYIIIFSAF